MCFAALHVGAIWIIHRVLELHSWLAWGADVLGSVAASLLAFWLFLPVAAAIGTMYFDRIAISVERRFYPWLPPPDGASFLEQAWDGIAVASRVLALNIVALLLAFLLPGIGVILGWMIAAYAIGRGLFVAVAMRRMPRKTAESLYRAKSRRGSDARRGLGADSVCSAPESAASGYRGGNHGPCPGHGPKLRGDTRRIMGSIAYGSK